MILVTGASGVLGKELCKIFQKESLSYKVAGRNKIENESWNFLDLKTGEGVEACVKDVRTIFHLASATRAFDKWVDVDGTRKLAAEAKRKGVEHFIFISIVGTDKVDMEYYHIKTETEEVVKSSGLNYSILRATQFHDLIDFAFAQFLIFPTSLFPKHWKIQPVEARAVAEKLVEISEANPLNGTINLGGREILETGTMVELWLKAKNKRKWLINLPNVGTKMKQIANGNLTCDEVAEDSIIWKEWLKNKYGN